MEWSKCWMLNWWRKMRSRRGALRSRVRAGRRLARRLNVWMLRVNSWSCWRSRSSNAANNFAMFTFPTPASTRKYRKCQNIYVSSNFEFSKRKYDSDVSDTVSMFYCQFYTLCLGTLTSTCAHTFVQTFKVPLGSTFFTSQYRNGKV